MSIYISQYPKYCVYLTIYSGNKLPPFYIGSGKIKNILNKNKPYHGSVSSKRYKKIWKQELKDNPHLFKTIIIEKFYSRKNATYHERLLQRQFNVVKSEQFINMAIASKNFADGSKHSEETKKLLSLKTSGSNNPMWGKQRQHNAESKLKISKSTTGNNNPNYGNLWNENQRINMSEKQSGNGNNNAKPIVIYGILYGSHKEAREKLNLSLHYFRILLKELNK